MDLTRAMHAVRAETDQEVEDCMRVRGAFLRDVVNDARTRVLFEIWADEIGLDRASEQLAAFLDRRAAAAGLDSRARFLDDVWLLYRAVSTGEARVALAQLMAARQELIAATRPARFIAAQGFVVAELYRTMVDEEVPVRAWLGYGIARLFEVLADSRLWGIPFQFSAGRPERIAPDNPRGKRGKRSHGSLEDYAHWCYRFYVAQPHATDDELANERLASLGLVLGKDRVPRDLAGIQDRPDTKTIRRGREKAKRLLELTVPPERWTARFDEFFPNRGGTIPS